MAEKLCKLWMPVTKSADGKLVAILSDTSLDRDDEFMCKELLENWSIKNDSLKALANHNNQMQSWVGGWTDLRTITKGNHTALIATPWFFTKEANPLAAQIEKQVEEAIAKGENPGISIGALPKKTIEKEIDGVPRKGYQDAELVEATWVPIQSNRNSSFGHIAKQFDLNGNGDRIVKEESIMKEKVLTQKEFDDALETVKKELNEEITKLKKAAEEKAEETVEDVVAEPKEEENKEAKEAALRMEVIEKKLKELTSKAVDLPKGAVEGPVAKKDIALGDGEDVTLEKMLKLQKARL